jgi:hypothetical protein
MGAEGQPPSPHGFGAPRRTEDGRQNFGLRMWDVRLEVRGQRSEVGGQKSDGREQMTEDSRATRRGGDTETR